MALNWNNKLFLIILFFFVIYSSHAQTGESAPIRIYHDSSEPLPNDDYPTQNSSQDEPANDENVINSDPNLNRGDIPPEDINPFVNPPAFDKEHAKNEAAKFDFDEDSPKFPERDWNDSSYFRNSRTDTNKNKLKEKKNESPQRPIEPEVDTNEQPKSSKSNSSFVTIPSFIFWGLGIVLILALIAWIVVNGKLGARNKKIKSNVEIDIHSKEATNIENLQNLRVETELEKAIRLGDFKTAIRLLYLNTLKLLYQNRAILPSSDKTNFDYYREISGKTYQQDFKLSTNDFEWVWYGEKNINESIFNTMHLRFNKLFLLITNNK